MICYLFNCISLVASASAKTCMILSMFSNNTLEDIALVAPGGLRWLQFYILNDRELTKALIGRAERAGYKALVFTVDAPVLGKRRSFFKSSPSYDDPGMVAAHFESKDQ